MKSLKLVGVLLLSIAFIFGCEDRTDLTAPAPPSTGDANFTTFVSIGNSLTAGYQNGGLYQSSQENSFGALIARQVKNVNYEQPTIDDPGTVGRLEIAELDLASGNISLVPNTTQGAPNNTTAAAYNNLGIPGILLADVLLTEKSPGVSGASNPLIDLVLRGQGTVLTQALKQQPTFVTVWIGNNDILGYALSGGVLGHTPEAIFADLFPKLVGGLAQSGAKGVVANIPDVKAVPYFTTIGPKIALALKGVMAANPAVKGLVYQHSTTVIGLATPEDLLSKKVLVTLPASPFATLIGDTDGKYYQMIGQNPPQGVNTAYPFGLTPENPWPTNLILDNEEISVTASVTASFNAVIKAATEAVGYKLVDINSFFNNIASNGYVDDGVHFTTDFVTGGLFSLDGIHPTSRGYAIVANEFIRVINSGYGASIPLIHVSELPGTLPLYGVTPKKINAPFGTFDKVLY